MFWKIHDVGHDTSHKRSPQNRRCPVVGGRADATIVGGNFALFFDGQDKSGRGLDGFDTWIRSHGFYYGDSGIFVRRAFNDSLGGLRPIALMEDYDFVRRLEVVGPTRCINTSPLISSLRWFHGRHPVAIV